MFNCNNFVLFLFSYYIDSLSSRDVDDVAIS